MPTNNKAEIVSRVIHKEFKNSNNIVLVTLDITYPEIYLRHSEETEDRINRQYSLQALEFYSHAATTLVKDAQQEYEDSIKNGFPFRPYDAVMKYTVTLNANCHLSTYFDKYEYTGGAHGNTIRVSDNWDLQTGRYIELEDLFRSGENYREMIIAEIIKIAEKEMADDPYIFFDDYKKLIVEYFNEESFNLNPKTLSIYYQQYDIGPYVSGIVVFEIPYETLGINKPQCFVN